jgi:hypothetical protein
MKRGNRLLILSIPLIVILTIGVIYEYGLRGIREELSSVSDLKTAKIQTLQKYMVALSHKDDFEKQLSDLKEIREKENDKIMMAQTTAIAAANLQDSVKSIITEKGGTINSDKVEKPEEKESFKIINVVMDANFPDVRALADALYAIETQTPYLVVKELDVKVRNYNDPKDLIVKLKIAALTGGK